MTIVPVQTMKPARQSPLIPEDTERLVYSTTPGSVRKFQEMVLSYYQRNGRDLPWRKTTYPYHILVSEIMLQQTQVSRVEERFPLFIMRFSDFSALASAPLPELLAAWQGMGYNRRALSLKNCSIRVVEEFDGKLPADPGILSTFPGIGTATAASICAFAFNMPVVFIETNIRRVFIHHFFPGHDTVADKELLPIVEQALYRKDPGRWYNALMDLGTDLKARVPNPNRRSRHYTKQSTFTGSDREIRGRILRQVLEKERIQNGDILDQYPGQNERIGRLLQDMEDEGFIVREGVEFSIPHGP